MCQLGASTALRTSTTQFDPSTHGTSETGATGTPSTGRLGTDELSIGQASTSHDTAVHQAVVEATRTSHSSPVRSSALAEPSSAVSAAPPRADADIVAQVAKASVPAPSLKDVLDKAGAAKAPDSGSTPEPVRLASSAEVRAKYGEAKDDIKIFGQKIYGMSTEYKGILKALDAYHKAAAEIDVNKASPADIKKLNDLLDRAEFAIGSYHGKREGIGDLAQGVAQERAFLLQAKAEGAADGVSFGAAAAGLQEKQLGTGGPQYQAIMEDARGLQGFLDKIPVGNGSGDAAKVLTKGLQSMLDKIDSYGGSQPEIKDLRAAVVDSQRRLELLKANPELLAGRKDGLYVAMNWGKALQSAPGLAAGLSEARRANGEGGKLRELGKGAVNTVYQADFQHGDAVKTDVVKFDLPAFPSFYRPGIPLDEQQPGLDAPDAVGQLNMNEQDPQLLQRAVASDDLAKAVSLPIRVPVRMAVVDGSLAGVMDKAPGVSNDKSGHAPVVKMADLQAHAKLKQEAYQPMEDQMQGLQARLATKGYSDKISSGLFNELRRNLQADNPPLQASSIAALSPGALAAKFGGRVSDMIDGSRQYFGVVPMEGGLGLQKLGSNGKPLEGSAPDFLMSTEEFTAIVKAGNDGRTKADENANRIIGSMTGWQRSNAAIFLEKGAGTDGKVVDSFVRGCPVDKDGFITAHRNKPIDIPYGHPELMEKLVDLQLADFLTGQLDRHPGNYFISKDSDGKFHVSAIDGDFSWGDKTVAKPADGGPKYIAPHAGYNHALDLPPVIDSAMKAKIEGLKGEKLEQLKATLADKLTATQLEAFDERVKALQAHIADSGKCTVIAEGAWGTDPAAKQMLTNPKNSYAAREMHQMKGFQDLGYPLDPPPWG